MLDFQNVFLSSVYSIHDSVLLAALFQKARLGFIVTQQMHCLQRFQKNDVNFVFRLYVSTRTSTVALAIPPWSCTSSPTSRRSAKVTLSFAASSGRTVEEKGQINTNEVHITLSICFCLIPNVAQLAFFVMYKALQDVCLRTIKLVDGQNVKQQSETLRCTVRQIMKQHILFSLDTP